MILDLFLFLMFISPVASLLFLLYKVSGLEELIKEWMIDRKRIRQLQWESQQVQGILDNMVAENVLAKMTSVERVELHEILAKEYPLWYAVYGKEMPYIPRNR